MNKDKNGIILKEGQEVLVPEPNESDAHKFAFRGFVDSFDGDYVVVVDQDDDTFMIECERLEVTD